MRLSRRTQLRALLQLISHQGTYVNSLVEDVVMVIVKAMVAAEIVEDPAALVTAVLYQAIKVLLKMLQTSVDSTNKAI